MIAERFGIELLCITETHKKSTDFFRIRGWHVFHSGAQVRKGSDDWEQTFTGVSFLVHPKFRPFIARILPISGRLFRIDLHTDRLPTTVIGVYAPHNERPEDERTEFWEQLRELIESIPQYHALVVMGDFKVQLDGRRFDEFAQIGQFPFGRGFAYIDEDLTSNRSQCLQLCRDLEL